MNHNQSYSTVPHIPASRLQDADGSMRPHTYSVHPRPCAVIATEPYRPTACAGEHPYPAAYTATAHYSLLTANSPAAPPAPPAHPILHSTFFILHWTYTFSAKEKDSETGLSYFGSRYYSSDLSVWLSVDPMAAKYPSLSPYTYCANNPVRVVDPDGEEVWIIGDDASAVTKAFEQLQSSTSYKLNLRDNGKVGIIGGKAEYDDDKLLAKAINDNTIRVNVTAINGNSDDNVLGGAFMGNKVSTAKPSFTIPKPFQIIQGIAARYVNTFQTVDPFELEILDNIGVNSDGTKAHLGQCMLHEVTESYCGGLLAYKSSISAGNALKSPFAYDKAHNAATAQPNFNAKDKWQLNEMIRQIRKK